MKIVSGNLLALMVQDQFDIIVHGCNCFHTMGAGIARQLSARYPQVLEADRQTQCGDYTKLGSITVANTIQSYVVNGYTQYGMASSVGECVVVYDAVGSVFEHVKKLAKAIRPHSPETVRIGYPKIGAGLAGGDWNVISKIIDQVLHGMDRTLVVYYP